MNKHRNALSHPFNAAKLWLLQFFGLCLICLAAMPMARADMIIETTRIVYREGMRDVTFKVTNKSEVNPAFVQMWLDNGDQNASPEDIATPFTMSPPVARINAGRSQVVRLVFTGEKQAADKESVFWFNMLEVPPKSEEANKLTLAIRSRIKLFFRPKGLPADPMALAEQLEWTLKANGSEWEIEGYNPTPFHFSFFSFKFGSGDSALSFNDGGMLTPQSRTTYKLKDFHPSKLKDDAISLDLINDYGATSVKAYKLKKSS